MITVSNLIVAQANPNTYIFDPWLNFDKNASSKADWVTEESDMSLNDDPIEFIALSLLDPGAVDIWKLFVADEWLGDWGCVLDVLVECCDDVAEDESNGDSSFCNLSTCSFLRFCIDMLNAWRLWCKPLELALVGLFFDCRGRNAGSSTCNFMRSKWLLNSSSSVLSSSSPLPSSSVWLFSVCVWLILSPLLLLLLLLLLLPRLLSLTVYGVTGYVAVDVLLKALLLLKDDLMDTLSFDLSASRDDVFDRCMEPLLSILCDSCCCCCCNCCWYCNVFEYRIDATQQLYC